MTATLRPRRLVAPTVNRLVAALIDLAIVALPTLAIALLTAERFPLLGPAGSPGRFSDADQARIDVIGQGFHRAIEWDGALYASDLGGLARTALALGGAAFLATVAFPVLSGGRSPGKAVTGLRVVTANGGRATAGQHLIRTLAGPIDLFGLVVPGLLGALVTWPDPDRRRLGDRLAETRVTVLAEQTIRTTREVDGSDSAPARTGADPASGDLSVASSADEDEPAAILLTDTELLVETADGGASSTGGTSRSADVASPAPPLPPERRLDGSATRSPRSRRGAARGDVTPSTRPAAPGASWLGAATDYEGWAGAEPTIADRTRSDARPIDLVREAGSPAQAFDSLVFPESSLADGAVVTTTRQDIDQGTTERAEAEDDGPFIDPNEPHRPMWDHGRAAWVHRDRRTGRWFRHDAATDRWVPISPES